PPLRDAFDDAARRPRYGPRLLLRLHPEGRSRPPGRFHQRGAEDFQVSSKPVSADDQFYREYILDHYKNPRNYGRLEHPDITHEDDNPLRGDVVGMDFRVKDGVIDDIRLHRRGCAIPQATASLQTGRRKRKPTDADNQIK